MTMLWMIEDLEGWPDDPSAGQVCEPTTYWATPATMDLPAELVCEVAARVEEVTVDDRRERVAHLGAGFTTIVPDGVVAAGETTLTGCLVWDRYMWMEVRTVPSGHLRVAERASLLRGTHAGFGAGLVGG